MEDIQSFFSQDLTNVDISRPLLKEGPVPFTVTDCKVEPNKAGDKQNLVITLKTRYEQKSSKGVVIQPGFTHTERMTLTPTERYPAERIMQELKKFQLGCGRSGAFGEPSTYIGANVVGNVIVDSDASGIYGDQNRIRSWVPAKP